MKTLIITIIFMMSGFLYAQDENTDLGSEPANETNEILDKEADADPELNLSPEPESAPEPVKRKDTGPVFSGSNLIHMPSTQPLQKSILDFRFNHRFGSTKETFQDFFGLDNGANTEIALDYGLTDNFSIGISRFTVMKTYEVKSKYTLFTQSSSFPVDISLFGAAGLETQRQVVTLGPHIKIESGNQAVDEVLNRDLNQYTLTDSDKTSYMAAVLISRKFWDRISLQISPVFVHRNFVKQNLHNDRLGLGFGGKIKIYKALTLVFETIFLSERDYTGDNYETEDRKSYGDMTNLTADEINQSYNKPSDLPYVYLRNVYFDKKVPYLYTPFSIGLGYETGGHTYSVFITNENTLARTQLLRGAEYDYFKREWTIGFNISRYYSFAKEINEDNF